MYNHDLWVDGMLRDILIDRDLFEKIQEKVLEENNGENIELKKKILERSALKRLRKRDQLNTVELKKGSKRNN